MKKTLSIILSVVMLVTSLACIFTSNLAVSAAVGYSEDFESYSVGTDIAANDSVTWKVYDEGEDGYFKGTPSTDGWISGGNGTYAVTTTQASTTGGKSMAVPSWGAINKIVDVKPNMDYTVTLKYYGESVNWRDFNILDASAATSAGYSFKSYLKFTPAKAYNKIQLYDKTLMPCLVENRNKDYTANKWNDITLKFTTTTEIKKVILSIAYEGSGSMYVDDIKFTYTQNEEAAIIFKDGSFEKAAAANTTSNITSNANGNVRSNNYKKNKQDINANGWTGSHYGSANVLKGETTYKTSGGDITTPKAQDGNQMIRLTTAWQTVAKVVNLEANTDYALTYYYYADKSTAGFMSSMDCVIGLNSNATTITIPVTKYEADGVTIKDCGGDILVDGTDGQKKIALSPASGDSKSVTNAWTKRTLYFNSGSFTKAAIPFYFKEGNVYIDNVNIEKQVKLGVSVKITGKDNKNAGIASVALNDEGDKVTYTAKAFSNAEFLGWYDGDNKVSDNLVYTTAYSASTFKKLEARFKCLYKNEFADGYIDTLVNGDDVLTGRTVKTTSSAKEGGGYNYKMVTTPNSEGWISQQNSHTAIVKEKANGTDTTNKALAVHNWGKVARVVEVKPETEYTLSYDYFRETGCELGSFNVYDVSNYTGGYSGRNDYISLTTTERDRTKLYMKEDGSAFPEIPGMYVREASNSGSGHNVWLNYNRAFETGKDTTKILIVWSNEGNKPLLLDNITLTSKLVFKANIVVEGVAEDGYDVGTAAATLNDDGDKLIYKAKAYKNAKFLGWYDGAQELSTNTTYTVDFDLGTYKVIDAKFECLYANEFNGGGFDHLGEGKTVNAGQEYAITNTSAGKYQMNTAPNTDGWMVHNGANAKVAVKAEPDDASNKALQIGAWNRIARVLDVTPNSDYTLEFSYYMAENMEFGSFSIQNVSNLASNKYIGRDDENAGHVDTNNGIMFEGANHEELSAIPGVFYRASGRTGNHDKWQTKTVTFTTDINTTKILIAWYPECNVSISDKNLYLDNIILHGEAKPYPIIPKAKDGQGHMGGVYPDTGYIPVGETSAELTFMASANPGYEFVEWEVENGTIPATQNVKDPVYTGTFSFDTKLIPVYKESGDVLVKDNGMEDRAEGENMLDNTNTPAKVGDWFAAWSTDGSDGNGPSKGTTQNQKFWTQIKASSEQARSGKMSVKLEKSQYQIVGRDFAGLEKNTDYLLTYWIYMPEETGSLSFASIIPKTLKDKEWQNGECNSSNLNTYGFGGEALSYVASAAGNLTLTGDVDGWQRVAVKFNTKEYTAVTLLNQLIDQKRKTSYYYIDDLGIEKLDADTKLYSATSTYHIGGKSKNSVGSGNAKEGDLVMFVATPRSDITFDGWYVPGTTTNPVSTNRFYVTNINEELAYQARFNAIRVKLDSIGLGGDASVDKTENDGVYPDGTEVTFTAKPYEGNTFDGWYDTATDTVVSHDEVYTAKHYDDIILAAKFSGNNIPAREILGFNGFEDFDVGYEFKENPGKNYLIIATSNDPVDWVKYRVDNKRAFEGKQSLYLGARYRTTRMQFSGLSKNTTYKVQFVYKMAEADPDTEFYAWVGPKDMEDVTSNKTMYYKFNGDASPYGDTIKSNKAGRGWSTYELYFNSGDLTEVEFGLSFQASTPPTGTDVTTYPYGYDSQGLYMDNLEVWEYATNAEVYNGDMTEGTIGWISDDNSATTENDTLVVPGNKTAYQMVETKPFTQYLLTFKAKASDLKAGVMGIDSQKLTSKSAVSSISWVDVKDNSELKEYTVAFTTGNEEGVAIGLTNNGNGNAYIDDVNMIVDEIGYSEGVIEKVDFETERFAVNNYVNNEIVFTNPNEEPEQKEGFEIYTAKSVNDENVLNGKKSLKIKARTPQDVAHKLWQAYMTFPTASLDGNYLITFNYKFASKNGGSIYLTPDAAKNYTLQDTYTVTDDEWHKTAFSIDNTLGEYFLTSLVGTVAGSESSDIYVDDITFQLHPALITEGENRYTYCENLYNTVENNDFEEKLTDLDWKGMPSEYKIVKGNAFTNKKYLKAGKSEETYTKKINVKPSQSYYVGISIKGTKGTKGIVSLKASGATGKAELFRDIDKTLSSKITYKGSGEWQRTGFKFVAPSNGVISLEIDTRNGAIDVDNIMIFPIKYKYTYDPNDYFKYKPYNFDDLSNAIINGGVGAQPYYDGDLSLGIDKDPYAAGAEVITFNPLSTHNKAVDIIIITLSMLSGLAAVSYLIVKNKKKEVK